MMIKSSTAIAADFDRIAAALGRQRTERRLTRAERFALRQLPPRAKSALDVGCGDGRLTRALAARGLTTLGIDLSPGMIALARQRAAGQPSLEFRVADIMEGGLPKGAFDFVVSVAMVHHVALDEIVPRLAAAVAPGGALVIQDVTTRPGLGGLPLNALAWLTRRVERLAEARPNDKLIAALYAAHGEGEEYLRASTVAARYRDLLGDAEVHLHLEWRYTIIWRRPVAKS